MIGSAIGYIDLVFGYRYWISNMCKQVADTDIHNIYYRLCVGEIKGKSVL